MTGELFLLAVRVVAGGTLVVAFALLIDRLNPKTLGGLFAAAPTVATASLLVTGFTVGASRDAQYAVGMIAGAIGLACFSLAAAPLVKLVGAFAGSVIAWLSWGIAAMALYWLFLR